VKGKEGKRQRIRNEKKQRVKNEISKKYPPRGMKMWRARNEIPPQENKKCEV
jgi:hypothetical protein